MSPAVVVWCAVGYLLLVLWAVLPERERPEPGPSWFELVAAAERTRRARRERERGGRRG